MANFLVTAALLFLAFHDCQPLPTNQDIYPNKVPDCAVSNAVQFRRRGKRIVGGNPAYPGKWPWIAALMFNNSQYCGGSIVNDKWIVTAAHCFHASLNSLHPKDWEVKVGKFNLTAKEPHEQTRKVKSIIRHPKYIGKWDEFNLDEPDVNDIAMLELTTPLQFTQYVQPVQLLHNHVFHPGDVCTVAGWGHTTFQGTSPDQLHDVNVKLVSHTQCNSPQSYNNTVTDSSFCAGYEKGGHDACQYDSGGPLVCCAGLRQWYLVGEVSWGHKCAEPHKYGVYTNMEKLTPWVKMMAAKS